MSYASSYHYETIYIFRPNLSEADVTELNQKIDNVIQKFEGTLTQRDDLGIRELAYEIDDESNGRYCVITYTGKTGVVDEIERHFRISDGVIRFITVNVPKDYDYGKVKRQIHAAEEEIKKNRELRKGGRGDFGGGGRDFGGGGRSDGGGRMDGGRI